MIWYGLHLLAWLIVLSAAVLLLLCLPLHTRRGYVRKEAGRFTPGLLMASGVLILVSRKRDSESGWLAGGWCGRNLVLRGRRVAEYSLICHVPESGRWG